MLKFTLIFPSVSLHLFNYPHPSLYLVILPQLPTVNIRVFCLLSHWGTVLQLCTSQMQSYVCFFFFFAFLALLILSVHLMYTVYLQTHVCVDLKSCMASVFQCFLLCCVEFVWVLFCSLLQAAVEKVMKEKMPKKGGRWWFSWRGRNSSTKSVNFLILVTHLTSALEESD